MPVPGGGVGECAVGEGVEDAAARNWLAVETTSGVSSASGAAITLSRT